MPSLFCFFTSLVPEAREGVKCRRRLITIIKDMVTIARCIAIRIKYWLTHGCCQGICVAGKLMKLPDMFC